MQKIKYFFIVFLFLFLVLNCLSQKNMENNIFEKYYPFDGYLIDLDKLERLEIDILPASDFKRESIYYFRFYAPRNWVDNFYQSVVYKNNVFSIKNNHSILVSDYSSQKRITEINRNNKFELENSVGNHFLFSTKTGVIEVKKISNLQNYVVTKYDEKGNIIFETEIEHTYIKIEGNTHHSNPYLGYLTCTNEFLVFNSYDKRLPKTVTVNLIDGKVTIYRANYDAVIRTDNEDNIPGFLEIKENGFKCTILNNVWRANVKDLYSNTAETLVKDTILVIAFYHTISTGSSLFAYNLHTGKLLWHADVVQIMASHSEYWNTVYLSSYKNLIIMEGVEAYGEYVQIFDVKTGKRLFSTL